MAASVKLSQQPRTESCAVPGTATIEGWQENARMSVLIWLTTLPANLLLTGGKNGYRCNVIGQPDRCLVLRSKL